jgi:hypothetical protein
MGLKLDQFQAAQRVPMQLEDEAQEKIRKVLNALCTIVADFTGASSVLIAKRNPLRKSILVRGSVGTLIKELDMSFAMPALDQFKTPTLAVPDVRLDQRFVNHPMLKLAPHIRSFIAILLPSFSENERAVLHIINPKRSTFSDAAIWRELANFSTAFEGVLQMENDVAVMPIPPQFMNSLQGSLFEAPQAPVPEASNSILRNTGGLDASVDFLFDTLVKKRTLHSRKGVDYLTLRSWRAQLKPYQISTLISLKTSKPSILVRRATDEIVSAVRLVYGEGVIAGVVPVPPGSSGDENSFSVMLAREVATELNVPCHNVLVPQGQKGKSSPIKSANLKPYIMRHGIECPVLVIDDVATSGTHMELAVNALRQSCKAVFGVAWIGK